MSGAADHLGAEPSAGVRAEQPSEEDAEHAVDEPVVEDVALAEVAPEVLVALHGLGRDDVGRAHAEPRHGAGGAEPPAHDQEGREEHEPQRHSRQVGIPERSRIHDTLLQGSDA